jgi:hypothetical protein
MQNYRRNARNLYRKPARTLEIAGSALPRWTPPYIDMLPQGEDSRPVLIPVSLEGQETIGQPYRYVVRVVLLREPRQVFVLRACLGEAAGYARYAARAEPGQRLFADV